MNTILFVYLKLMGYYQVVSGMLGSGSHFKSLQTFPTTPKHDEQVVENLMR